VSFTVEKSIHIDRPPSEVWEHVSRLDEELRWRRPYVVKLLADGDPLEPGTRIDGTTRAFGQTDHYASVVTEVEAPRRLAWRGVEVSGGLMGTRGRYELEPEAGGTRFRLHMEYAPLGIAARLTQPVLAFALRRIGARFLRQLKELTEDA
jgi:uncharacterized protein YndB with AHSA1/START domain